MNLKTSLRARLGQDPDKILPVHIRFKNLPLAIGPAHDTCPAVTLAKADGKWLRDIQL
jgi:hypothetical protein